MQRVGYVLHISSNKSIILKAENIPRIGDEVFNETLKPVGIISDLFGPVSSPYVSVKTNITDPQRLVKHVLYVNPSFKPRGGRKHK